MFKFCYLVLLYIVLCDSARILVVIPVPSRSHHIVFKPIIKDLANRGHKLTVFSVDPDTTNKEKIPNVEDINMYYKYQGKFTKNVTINTAGKKTGRKGLLQIVYSIFKEAMWLSDEFQQISTNNFDLVIAEACVEPAIIIAQLLRIPVITMSTFSQDAENFESLAAPFDSFIYQSFVHEIINNLSTLDRLSAMYKDIEEKAIFTNLNNNFEVWLEKYTGFIAPTITDLKSNICALFWFTHPVWEHLPVPSNVISIWSLYKKPKKEIPQDLKTFLDESINGVIYVSFGSIILPSLLPPDKIRMLIRVFSQLPYDVLLKWDQDEVPGQTTNIKISKWVPQSDILEHPKLKLFITHGGLQSTEEAINAGVPLIGIPMYGDQWYNTEKYVYHKIGIQLQLNHLRDEEILTAIDTVVKDDSYRQNVRRLGSLLRDQPQSPLQRAVWWTEHVLRHPDVVHLRAPAANISWTEYHQIDLISIIFLILLSILILLFSIIRFVWFRVLFRA